MTPAHQGLFRIERKQTIERRKDEKKKLTAPVELRQAELVIGTRSSADLVTDDPVVADRHCAIRFEGGSYQLRDLENASGTYLNGVRVEKPEHLASGDRIVIGVTTIEVLTDSATGALVLQVFEGGFFFAIKKRGEFESDSDEWVRSEVAFGRMPLLLALNALGVVLACAAAWWLWFQPAGKRALQPAPLSSAHAALFSDSPPTEAHLAGFVAIAQEQGCAACHESYDRPSVAKCASCHEDVVQGATLAQAHPFRAGEDLECNACHTEHHGAMPPADTLMPADIEARCSDCHGDDFATEDGLMAGLVRAGEKHDLAPTTTEPVARVVSLGHEAFTHGSHSAITDCAVCHVPTEPGSAWDFGLVTFEGCMDCHSTDTTVTGEQRPADEHLWKTTWHGAGEAQDNCTVCHANGYEKDLRLTAQLPPAQLSYDLSVRSHTDQFHGTDAPGDCLSCHVTGAPLQAGRVLEGRPFLHSQHLSALLPGNETNLAMVEAQCQECHTARATSGALTLAPDAYAGPPIEACATCHQQDGEPLIAEAGSLIGDALAALQPSDQVDFPHDRHMQVEGGCFACHEISADSHLIQTKPEATSCVQCHVESDAGKNLAHTAIGGGDCSACHMPRPGEAPGMAMAAVFYGAAPADRAPSNFPHAIEAHQGESCTFCHGDPAAQPDVHSPLESAVSCRECHARSRFHWR